MRLAWSTLPITAVSLYLLLLASGQHVALPRPLSFCSDKLGKLSVADAAGLRSRLQRVHQLANEQSSSAWAALDGKPAPPSAAKGAKTMQQEEEELHRQAAQLGLAPPELDCLLMHARHHHHHHHHRPTAGPDHDDGEQLEVSFMLQYFKRPWLLDKLVESALTCRQVVSCELLVNVDHPQDAGRWAAWAANTSGFVVPVFSNNVHEARAYNRLSALARGRILIILQDDELLPLKPDWLRTVVQLFERWPKLAALGHKTYRLNNNHDNKQDIGGRDMYFRDPVLQVPFLFVMFVDYAPMAVRKAALRHVGGVDETMSEPGECGIYSDYELCLRLWTAGWQVGYYRLPDPMQEDETGEPGGTHTPQNEERCWAKQLALGHAVFDSRWGRRHEAFQIHVGRHVRDLNLQLLVKNQEKWPTMFCPFGHTAGGCA